MMWTRGEGNPNAKIMIIGEYPSKLEAEQGRPFIGDSGRLLDTFLKEAGIQRSQTYLTNVVKVYPPARRFDKLKEIDINLEQQEELLFNEIKTINPNVIIALGEKSLFHLTGNKGITKWRGSILTTKKGLPKVIPTFSPSAFVGYGGNDESDKAFKYYQKYITIFDFKRAVDQSRLPSLRLPERTLRVVKNSSELYDFIRRNETNKLLSVDIESHNCVPTALGLAFKPNEAISIPILDVYNPLTLSGIGITELTTMWVMIDKLLRSKDILGQNFKFDESKLRCIGLEMKLFADTMLMSHTLNPEFPQSLAFNTSIYTEEPYYKDEGKEFNPKKDPFSRLLLYNAKDAAVTLEIYYAMLKELEEAKLKDFYFNHVHKQHYLYSEIESRGIKIDLNHRAELTKLYKTKSKDNADAIEKIIGYHLNLNAHAKVGILLYKAMGFPEREGVDEDTLVALLANHAKTEDKRNILNLIIDGRKINKTLSTYLLAKPDYDGRMRTSIRITGTENARTSNAIMKPPVRPEKLGIAFQTLTKHGSIGPEIRKFFIPDPGYIFLNADLSQAEARIVALLSEDKGLLEDFEKERDVHAKAAAIIFGGKWEQYTKSAHNGKECNERFMGKTTRHAGNYDMGKNRLMLYINTSAKKFNIDLTISEYRAGLALDKFHKAYPNIRKVFHARIKQQLTTNRTLTNPFGRIRTFYERWDSSLFREAYAYIPQSTVHDHLVGCMLRIQQREPSIQFLIESHDAFLSQINENDLDRIGLIILEEFRTPINFSRCSIGEGMLVIPGEIEIGTNYKDLKRWK